MAEPALAAIYRAINQRLTTSGDVWANRVYADRAQPGNGRPYVRYGYQGGGEANQMIKPDANIVVTVRAVAETQAQAFALCGRLSDLLNDMGEQDRRPEGVAALNGGPDWHIRTTTQEGVVHLSELVDSTPVYHEGFFLRLIMEARV